MGQLFGESVRDGQDAEVVQEERLAQIDIRIGEIASNSRKCRACKLPLYPSEGVEQLCPWCYPIKENLVCSEPYDPLQEQLLH